MALTQVPVSMVDFSVNPTLSGGTANGVAYLNGSKVLTTGSALTFDGSIVSNTGVGFNVNNANALYRFQNGSGTRTGYFQVRADAFEIWSDQSAVPMVFGTSNTEQMRLTSSGLEVKQSQLIGYSSYAGIGTNGLAVAGNVGIGTSSPSGKLHTVQSNGINYFESPGISSIALQFVTNSSNRYRIGIPSGSTDLQFLAGGTTETMRLDSSGNLGLGVTPSAWSSSGIQSTAIQIKDSGPSGRSSSLASAGGDLQISNNAFFNGTNWIYQASSFAANYYQSSGTHVWRTASSGTAGFPITFTQAMTLDASGNLGVGSTSISPAYGYSKVIEVAGQFPGVKFAPSGASTFGFQIGAGTGGFQFYDVTAAAERARIDSSGNLLIGTTSSDGSRLRVYGSYQTLGDGSYEGLIGKASSLVSGGGAGEFAIRSSSNLLFATNGNTERARITSGGEVYIAGTTDQGAYNLQVNGTGVWGAGAYVNGSDARLKEEVQDLAPALDVIASLRPVTFRYKEDYSKDQNVQPGFIAQELQTAMAGQAYVDGVIQSGPQHLNVAYQSLIPLLTKAIQELKAEFDAYKATHP